MLQKSENFKIEVHYNLEYFSVKKIFMSLYISKCSYRSSTSNFNEMLIFRNFLKFPNGLKTAL